MGFDIAIIGAGLAGLSAARSVLARGDLSLAIIEARGIGSNNPSPLTFLDVLAEHELLDCIKEKYSTFTFHNLNGSSVKYVFPNESLVILDYRKACNKIFNQVDTDDNNLEFIDEYVTNIEPTNNGIHISLENGNRIFSKILIDASGKSQLVASKLAQRNTAYYSHVFGALFTNVKDLSEPLCCFLLPSQELGSGGGWFYSLGSNAASFGYAQITDHPKTDNKALKTIFQMAQEKFEPYSKYLQQAKIHHIEQGVIPISHVNRFVYGNILVVGDAAGMATNWTCMGIEPALKYGELAGKLAAAAIMENGYGKLRHFQQEWDKENKSSFGHMMKLAPTFWNSDHYFWEWIIKNDLAYLSPEQAIYRLKNNGHLLKKHQIVMRTLNYKIRSKINTKNQDPRSFIINT